MKIFDVPQAQHYCSHFSRTAGPSEASLTEYVRAQLLAGPGSVKEGTHGFDSYRDCALREVERLIFLAMSNYRRTLDLMVPAAAGWAHVTLYYSAYFSARALIGMFGGWIGMQRTVIEVDASQPGSQILKVTRRVPTTYNGSHERFWDLFYDAVQPLVPWVDSSLRPSMTPINSDPTWQIQNRNDINYDSYEAMRLVVDFQKSFRPSGFPDSLPGRLNTQFTATEGLLLVSASFARDFGLITDALDMLAGTGPSRPAIARLASRGRAPALVKRSKWGRLVR